MKVEQPRGTIQKVVGENTYKVFFLIPLYFCTADAILTQ